MPATAKLALSDGTVFAGQAFGATGEVFGEVVFNTSMTGYQEILTDPSYCGQIVTMTYPLIGNYGVNPEDVESGKLSLRGFVCRELCRHPSNFRCSQSLGRISHRERHHRVGRHRHAGIGPQIARAGGNDGRAVHGRFGRCLADCKKPKQSPELVGRDLVREVIPQAASEWTGGLSELAHYTPPGNTAGDAGRSFMWSPSTTG